MSDGSPVPGRHDGMAAFAGDQGQIILVRNHELSPDKSVAEQGPAVLGANPYDPKCKGGTTTLVLNGNRQLLRDYVSLSGTVRNCAGGATPWGSWISCEENTATPQTDPGVSKPHGYAFEVPSKQRHPCSPSP